jgi:hypothetical protein
VASVELDEGLFIVEIVWDALRGNRATRRKGRAQVHMWAFESEQLALEYLEVVASETVH